MPNFWKRARLAAALAEHLPPGKPEGRYARLEDIAAELRKTAQQLWITGGTGERIAAHHLNQIADALEKQP